jgi:hypothetical protein
MSNESFDRTASHMAGEYVSNNEPVASTPVYKSTSLRDAFAGQVLNALISRTKYGFDTEVLAKEAYMMADSMMKERLKW